MLSADVRSSTELFIAKQSAQKAIITAITQSPQKNPNQTQTQTTISLVGAEYACSLHFQIVFSSYSIWAIGEVGFLSSQ